ncbi:signal transduction histidine kinase [Paraburkholderia sp. UCT70]
MTAPDVPLKNIENLSEQARPSLGGEIVLDASASAEVVCVSVENQGQPISAGNLERIFDRFYRIDPSRSSLPSSALSKGPTGSAGSIGSTGLGLAIVRMIMELHGGSVHAQSDARSTRFVLMFPRLV